MEYPYMMDNCGMVCEEPDECGVFYYPMLVGDSQYMYETELCLQIEILNINLRNNFEL